MHAVRVLTGAASLPLRPVAMVRAALDAPRGAAAHPSSRELRRLLDAGYTITGYRLARRPDPVQVSLQRGDETAVVASADLAFAAYATQTLPRAADHARHLARRRGGLAAW